MDLKALMERKVFGIPVLYLVGGLVAILAVVAFRMKPGVDVPAEEETASIDAVDEGDPFGVNPPLVGGGGTPVQYPDPNTPSTVDDNDKWLRRAAEWLAGQGHATADQSMRALQRYLMGEQLSMAEGKLRDLAIDHFGYPPETVESGGDVPVPDPPTVPTTPTPKKYIAPGFHTVTGSSDDSYTDMARLFYGRTDNAAIDLIQSYNIAQGHEGPFKVGTRFWIPAYAGPKYVKATASMRTAAQIISKNPPLNSVKMLNELNDGMKFPVAIGTKVRVA